MIAARLAHRPATLKVEPVSLAVASARARIAQRGVVRAKRKQGRSRAVTVNELF